MRSVRLWAYNFFYIQLTIINSSGKIKEFERSEERNG